MSLGGQPEQLQHGSGSSAGIGIDVDMGYRCRFGYRKQLIETVQILTSDGLDPA